MVIAAVNYVDRTDGRSWYRKASQQTGFIINGVHYDRAAFMLLQWLADLALQWLADLACTRHGG